MPFVRRPKTDSTDVWSLGNYFDKFYTCAKVESLLVITVLSEKPYSDNGQN
jgi:hypothetical protein